MANSGTQKGYISNFTFAKNMVQQVLGCQLTFIEHCRWKMEGYTRTILLKFEKCLHVCLCANSSAVYGPIKHLQKHILTQNVRTLQPDEHVQIFQVNVSFLRVQGASTKKQGKISSSVMALFWYPFLSASSLYNLLNKTCPRFFQNS